MPGILITTSSFNLDSPAIQALRDDGYDIVMNPHARRLNESEVSALLTADIVGLIAGLEPLTRDVMTKASTLCVISRCGTGMDNVDQDAARECGISVFNTPDAPAAAVAELTVGLMLDALRGISAQDRDIRAGGWQKPAGGLLGAQTVGLIGLGRIGRRVASLVSAFGAQVLAYDPVATQAEPFITLTGVDELLVRSDIVSLHMPYTAENHHFMSAARLVSMKHGAILVNAARGGLVDEAALASALQTGVLSAAALDVFETEPYQGPLTGLPNMIMTAHAGSYAKETRALQEEEAALNLLKGLRETRKEGRAYA